MINVIDLFSGAGGLTFGFCYRRQANRFVHNHKFNFIFANEYDEQAAKAFSSNFPNIPIIQCDISDVTIDSLEKKQIRINQPVDLVIGGPPCQSYSTVGKRQYDQRARMYNQYTRMLSLFHPSMFVFENVTGLLTMKNDRGQPVIDDIRALFENIEIGLGYRLFSRTLNAKDYGVPQSRERVFIVGIRNDIDYTWHFPEPKYGTQRNPFLTVSDAISDLPILNCGQRIEEYVNQPQNDYQILMRGNQTVLYNHFCGVYGDKITTVIHNVPQGEGRMYINNLVDNGELDKSYYLTSGYKNTYGRLWWDRPCTTITNSLGTPSALRCIHPLQDRALSTREGARLQSFPDWCRFFGTKYQQNSQVGNAVPPLLAMALAKEIEKFPFENYRMN